MKFINSLIFLCAVAFFASCEQWHNPGDATESAKNYYDKAQVLSREAKNTFYRQGIPSGWTDVTNYSYNNKGQLVSSDLYCDGEWRDGMSVEYGNKSKIIKSSDKWGNKYSVEQTYYDKAMHYLAEEIVRNDVYGYVDSWTKYEWKGDRLAYIWDYSWDGSTLSGETLYTYRDQDNQTTCNAHCIKYGISDVMPQVTDTIFTYIYTNKDRTQLSSKTVSYGEGLQERWEYVYNPDGLLISRKMYSTVDGDIVLRGVRQYNYSGNKRIIYDVYPEKVLDKWYLYQEVLTTETLDSSFEYDLIREFSCPFERRQPEDHSKSIVKSSLDGLDLQVNHCQLLNGLPYCYYLEYTLTNNTSSDIDLLTLWFKGDRPSDIPPIIVEDITSGRILDRYSREGFDGCAEDRAPLKKGEKASYGIRVFLDKGDPLPLDSCLDITIGICVQIGDERIPVTLSFFSLEPYYRS